MGIVPGWQLVDITAAVFGPDDDFVSGDELPSGPGLVAVTGHGAEQRVVACIKHLTQQKDRKTAIIVAQTKTKAVVQFRINSGKHV